MSYFGGMDGDGMKGGSDPALTHAEPDRVMPCPTETYRSKPRLAVSNKALTSPLFKHEWRGDR